jgi:predicted phosphodiesterase
VRYALISDIHGNLEALEAVIKSIETEKPDRIICLGDIVGYGADPNYCVERIKSLVDIAIVGNHDHAAIGLTSTADFNAYAREAALWTAHILSPENKAYLQSLDYQYQENDLLFVHSTPYHPEMWDYLLSYWEAEWQFTHFEEKVCFIGHSHIPVEFVAERSSRRIINIGSVGQPRDEDPRACYYLYNYEQNRGRWIRVEYPFEIAARKILDAGLPKMLAQRLAWGR